MKRNLLIISALSFSILGHNAIAEEKKNLIEGEFFIEFNAADRHNSNNVNKEYQESFVNAEIASTINLPKGFTIESNLVFERINEPQGDREDRSIDEGHGGFVEELKLRYTHDKFSVFAGKFNPSYGIAWDFGRGIWTHKISEGYEQTQKLGGGFTYDLGKGHEIEVALFRNDRKVLDNTTIVNQDEPNAASDGSPGNTSGFKSYSVNLNAEDAFNIAGLSYRLGFVNLAIDKNNSANPRSDQKGYLAGLGYVLEVNDDLSFDMLSEVNKFDNVEGVTSADQTFFNFNVVTNIYKNWNVTLGYAEVELDQEAVSDQRTNQYQVSAGYEFKEESILEGLQFEVGYREFNEPFNDSTKSFGLLARYTKAF